MHLSLKQIRYICEVARLGSVLAAAESLNISQSSILAGIALGEQVLGTAVFRRLPARGVQITPAGRLFVEEGRKILAAYADFSQAVGSAAKRTPDVLRIGCGPAFGGLFLSDVLVRYKARAGNTRIMLFEGDLTQLQQWFANGTIDIVIAYDLGRPFADNVTPICRVPAHAVLPSDSPLASKSAVSVQELSTQPIILLDTAQTSDYHLAMFDLLAKRPEVAFQTRSYETIRSAVAAGFGFSILLLRPISPAMPDGKGIVRRPIQDKLPQAELFVADIYGKEKPYFVRLLTDVLREFLIEVGPNRFAVTTPEIAKTLFNV